ncbi:MAG: hypothetical protein JO257_33175 [Deltaproteobacteria bacterium]|nr:hypothetical protein [Deltaproteobacteria bacterium]
MKALVIVALLAVSVRAYAKGCHETSQVVGYEHCTWFGTWSRDTPVFPLWFELTYYRHAFTAQPYTLDGAALSTTPGDDLTAISGGPMFRILAGRLLYAGLEGGGGWLSTLPHSYGATQPGWGGYMSGHIVGGAHVVLWRFGLGAELAAGGRWAVLANCNAKADPMCMQVQSSQTSREVELRARADIFIVPQWSLGVVVGKSLLDDNDHELLITTGFHVRALDGAP